MSESTVPEADPRTRAGDGTGNDGTDTQDSSKTATGKTAPAPLSGDPEASTTQNQDQTAQQGEGEGEGEGEGADAFAIPLIELCINTPRGPLTLEASIKDQVMDLVNFCIASPLTCDITSFHLEYKGVKLNPTRFLCFYEDLILASVNGPAQIDMKLDPYDQQKVREHIARFQYILEHPPTNFNNLPTGVYILDEEGGFAGSADAHIQGLARGGQPGKQAKSSSSGPGSSPGSNNEQLSLIHVPIDTKTPRPLPACVCELGLSSWNPVPSSRAIHGDLLYLNVLTLEGRQVTITASTEGFFVNRSSPDIFDPRPVGTPEGKAYKCLVDLLKKVSSIFASAYDKLINSNLMHPLESTDAPLPNHPWIVKPLQVENLPKRQQNKIAQSQAKKGDKEQGTITVVDPFAQIPYPRDSQEQIDALGIKNFKIGANGLRDWNSEYQAARECPRSTPQQRIFRDTMVAKCYMEFLAAATKGAMEVVDGVVPPINALDHPDAQLFCADGIFYSLSSQMLFDPSGNGSSVNVDKEYVSREVVIHDLEANHVFSSVDVPSVRTLLMAVIDYKGYRVVAQGCVPGILYAAAATKHSYGLDNGEWTYFNEEQQKGIELVARALHLEKQTIVVPSPESVVNPTEESEESAPKTPTPHQIYTAPETKGITGSDDRTYLLELKRVTPYDYTGAEGEELNAAKILRPELVAEFCRHRAYEQAIQKHADAFSKQRAIIRRVRFLEVLADRKSAKAELESAKAQLEGNLEKLQKEAEARAASGLDQTEHKKNEHRRQVNETQEGINRLVKLQEIMDKEHETLVQKINEAKSKAEAQSDSDEKSPESVDVRMQAEELERSKDETAEELRKRISDILSSISEQASQLETNVREAFLENLAKIRVNINAFLPSTNDYGVEGVSEESKQLVRDIIAYRDQVVLPQFVKEQILVGDERAWDAATLISTMYARGIDIYQLPAIARQAQTYIDEAPKHSNPKGSNLPPPQARKVGGFLSSLAQHTMLSHVAAEVLNKFLRLAKTSGDAAASLRQPANLVAHFLSALLGSNGLGARDVESDAAAAVAKAYLKALVEAVHYQVRTAASEAKISAADANEEDIFALAEKLRALRDEKSKSDAATAEAEAKSSKPSKSKAKSQNAQGRKAASTRPDNDEKHGDYYDSELAALLESPFTVHPFVVRVAGISEAQANALGSNILSPHLLWHLIRAKTDQIFGWQVPTTLPDDDSKSGSSQKRIGLLRDICKQVGVQLVARKFDFGSESPIKPSDLTGIVPVAHYKLPESKDLQTIEFSTESTLAQGGIEQAFALSEEGLALASRVYHHVSPQMLPFYRATVLSSLGEEQVNHEYVLEAQQRALIVARRTLGIDHPDTAAAHAFFAYLCARAQKYNTALVHIKRALYLAEITAGHAHPDTLNLTHDLAIVMMALGNHQGAALLLQEAAARTAALFGTYSVEHAEAMHNLAVALLYAHRVRDALEAEKYARAIYGQLDPEDPRISGSTHLISQLIALAVQSEGPRKERALEYIDTLRNNGALTPGWKFVRMHQLTRQSILPSLRSEDILKTLELNQLTDVIDAEIAKEQEGRDYIPYHIGANMMEVRPELVRHAAVVAEKLSAGETAASQKASDADLAVLRDPLETVLAELSGEEMGQSETGFDSEFVAKLEAQFEAQQRAKEQWYAKAVQQRQKQLKEAEAAAKRAASAKPEPTDEEKALKELLKMDAKEQGKKGKPARKK